LNEPWEQPGSENFRNLLKINQDDVIALSSYPRSGNSLIRLLLEKVTAIWSGSIYHDSRLVAEGWKGEDHYKREEVIFVKTHDPFFPKFSKDDFHYGKILHIVRNPFDSIDSYFNLEITKTHNQTLDSSSLRTDYARKWFKFVKEQSQEWKKHFEYWNQKQKLYPYLLIKYEDLWVDPRLQLEKIINWTYPHDHQDNLITTLLQNVECACKSTFNEKEKYREGYQVRKKDLENPLYTQQELFMIFKMTAPVICSLGYGDYPGNFSQGLTFVKEKKMCS